MTQDQHGQAQGTGPVVRGEVVTDDETQVSPDQQSAPMTRLVKVAAALRGDRSEDTPQAGADTPDPDGSGLTPPAEPTAVSNPDMADAADSVRPDEVGARPSPGAGSRDDWDDEEDRDGTRDPSGTPTALYSATAATAAGTGSAPYDAYTSQGGTAADYGGQDVTAGGYGSRPGTTPGYGSRPGTTPGYGSRSGTTPGYGSRTGSGPGYGTEAGTAAGYGSRDVTATDPPAPAGLGPAATGGSTAEPGTAGRHAAGAAEAGLRPGEATDRLGDFGDIAFGNLLPDADQYTAQWHRIQFRFVDDPQDSVMEAADVVSQVTAKLEAAIQERQRAIEQRQRAIQERASALRGRWGEGSNADTETLRETLRMYRAFMDQLIGGAR